MKKRYILSLLIASCALTSCFHKDKPNYQYMADTDMYFPVGYETYQEAPKGTKPLRMGWKHSSHLSILLSVGGCLSSTLIPTKGTNRLRPT